MMASRIHNAWHISREVRIIKSGGQCRMVDRTETADWCRNGEPAQE